MQGMQEALICVNFDVQIVTHLGPKAFGPIIILENVRLNEVSYFQCETLLLEVYF